MSPTRSRIAKRAKRRRRAAQQRVRRMVSAEAADRRKAEAARRDRLRAIAVWNSHNPSSSSSSSSPSSSTLSASGSATNPVATSTSPSTSRVRFAPHILVSQIPTAAQHDIPPPVKAPVGVALNPSPDPSNLLTPSSSSVPPLQAARLYERFLAAGLVDPNSPPAAQSLSARLLAGIEAGHNPALLTPILDVTDDKNKDDDDDDTDSDYILPSHLSDDSSHRIPLFVTTRSTAGPRRIAPMRLSMSSSGARGNGTASGNGTKAGKRRRPTSADADAVGTASPSDSGDGDDDEATVCADSGPSECSGREKSGTESGGSPRRKKRRQLKADSNGVDMSSSGKCPAVGAVGSTGDGDDGSANADGASEGEESSSSGLQESGGKKSGKKMRKDSSRGKEEQKGDEFNDGGADESSIEELDELFAEVSKRKAGKREEKKKNGKRNGMGKMSEREGKNGGGKKVEGSRKFTAEGYRIMSMEEVTADQPKGLNGECPFECSCCF